MGKEKEKERRLDEQKPQKQNRKEIKTQGTWL